MPFDPLTFWLKGSMVWASLVRQQQQAYVRMLCNMANAVPHETAADVAAEAESMRRSRPKTQPLHRRPRATKAAQKTKPVPA